MARSLSIHHEETPANSPLLTAFLLLSVGWLAVTTIYAVSTEADAAEAPSVFNP